MIELNDILQVKLNQESYLISLVLFFGAVILSRCIQSLSQMHRESPHTPKTKLKLLLEVKTRA